MNKLKKIALTLATFAVSLPVVLLAAPATASAEPRPHNYYYHCHYNPYLGIAASYCHTATS